MAGSPTTVKSTRPTRSLRLIHTSDLHLGCEYAGELARRALRAVVDLACACDADALLIPGDIFDHNRVPDSELDYFLEQLARFAKTSIILPGNHDCFDESSVYRRPLFESRPDRVQFIGGDGAGGCLLPDLDLEVWGRPVVDHCRDFRPLAGAPARWRGSWRIALGHGHFEQVGTREPRSSPISPEEIAATNCDYVALGHWDVQTDVSQGKVRAFYSGAPYRCTPEGALAEVLMVSLDPVAGVGIEPVALD